MVEIISMIRTYPGSGGKGNERRKKENTPSLY